MGLIPSGSSTLVSGLSNWGPEDGLYCFRCVSCPRSIQYLNHLNILFIADSYSGPLVRDVSVSSPTKQYSAAF